MKKGGITVFLSLVLMVVLSLVLVVVNGARDSANRMQIECVTDMGLNSIFAEYHRELLNQYDLFFIDTSYGSQSGCYENVEEHLKSYMEYNFHPAKGVIIPGYREWLDLSVNSATIIEASIASDYNGGVFKRQAVNFIKDKYGVNFLTDIQSKIEEVDNYQLADRNITEERNEVERSIDAIEIPQKQVDKDKWEDIPLNNPADGVNALRSSGILSLVIKDQTKLSSEAVDLSQYISNRETQKGNRTPSGFVKASSPTNELFFGEYIMEKFGNYVEPLTKGKLKYQIEYILAGKNNDVDNLDWIANRLVAMREVANMVYLFSDARKVGEADALAASLSAVVLVPELQPLVKLSILFAWGYAESVVDVRTLLSGGKIPIMKTENTWKLGLEQMLNFTRYLDKNEKDAKGVDYQTYLKILLSMMNPDTKAERCMNIIEMDIRTTSGNGGFCLDSCLDSATIYIDIYSSFGYKYEIKRTYGYDYS